MSALIAVFNRQGKPVETNILEQVLSASASRAIDGQNCWQEGAVALVHQHFWANEREQTTPPPFLYKQVTVTGVAHFTNWDLLCRQLDFPLVGSAVALVAHAHLQWGIDCVKHFRGEFAFALWDERKQELFVARDVLGKQSLCYFVDDSVCVVASELRQLLAHSATPRRLNAGKVADWLVGTWVEPYETMYCDLFYLPPGHALVVSAETSKQWRFKAFDPTKKSALRSIRLLSTISVIC